MGKKKILLTGGNSFIGRNIISALDSYYHIFSPGHAELDCIDPQGVSNFFHKKFFDVVIHCANMGGNRNSPYIPDLVEKNVRMLINIQRQHSHYGKLIQLGSGAEYDKSLPIKSVKEGEFDKRVPVDQYGFAKYLCSKYLESQYDSKFISLRLFGVFGEYEDYTTRFISNSLCRIILGLPIVIKQNVFFDYLYILDLVNVIKYFIDNDHLNNEFFNVGSGVKRDLKTIAQIILETTGVSQDVIIVNTGVANEYTCNNDKLKSLIGDIEQTPFDTAILKLYRWYVSRRDQLENQRAVFSSYL